MTKLNGTSTWVLEASYEEIIDDLLAGLSKARKSAKAGNLDGAMNHLNECQLRVLDAQEKFSRLDYFERSDLAERGVIRVMFGDKVVPSTYNADKRREMQRQFDFTNA